MNAKFVTSYRAMDYRIFIVTSDDRKAYIVTLPKRGSENPLLEAPCPCCMNDDNRVAIESAAEEAIASGISQVFWPGQWCYNFETQLRSLVHNTKEGDAILADEQAAKLVAETEVAKEKEDEIISTIQTLVRGRRYADAKIFCDLQGRNLSNFVQL